MVFPQCQRSNSSNSEGEVKAPVGAEEAMCWGPYDESDAVEEQRVFHWDPEFFRTYTGVGRFPVQSVNGFKSSGCSKYGTGGRSIVYIMPLGACWSHSFSSNTKAKSGTSKKTEPDTTVVPPQLDVLRRYLAAFFFGIPVVLLDPVPLPAGRRKAGTDGSMPEVRSRINENNPPSRKVQRYAPDIIQWIKLKTPSDTYCVLGITHYDLYNSTAYNHCVGASAPGVAVVSFARLEPAFYGGSRNTFSKRLMRGEDEPETTSSNRGEHWYLWMLKRVCRVSCHEMLHSIGIKHCNIFECLMNAEGVQDVDDMGKSLLCPICLKKFQYATNIDVLSRYKALGGFCQDFQIIFGPEGSWICGRFEWIARGMTRVRLPMSAPYADGTSNITQQSKHGQEGNVAAQGAGSNLITATVPQMRAAPPVAAKHRRSIASQRSDSASSSTHNQSHRSILWSLHCSS